MHAERNRYAHHAESSDFDRLMESVARLAGAAKSPTAIDFYSREKLAGIRECLDAAEAELGRVCPTASIDHLAGGSVLP